MRAQLVGLGQFGMFLTRHFLGSGFEVFGFDTDVSKKTQLENLGGVWGDTESDVRVYCVFPWDIQNVPDDGSLVVNLSSVQEPGVRRLLELGVASGRVMSFHPLFGPVGVSQSGLGGKQIILTLGPEDDRGKHLLDSFIEKGVWVERMSVQEHDNAMLSHALAFYFGELIDVGSKKCNPKYLTGSASHMLGLLQFTGRPGSSLSKLILSNPAMREVWQKIQARNIELAKEFGWE
jgi:prephenate dehydrogenase